MWQWRNSKIKERLTEKGGPMMRQAEVYENLKLLGDYLLIKFKTLRTFKMLWFLFKVYECFSFCSRQLWQFLQLIV